MADGNIFQEKHGFWFDIQDVTGTTLSAKARFQINMNVPKIANYDDLAHINNTVIPILWMEEGIDELGPEIIGVLKQAVTEPREWRQVILWVCLGMFATLVVLAGVALARVILNRSKVERVRENLESIISNGLQHENNCQLIQPMLGKKQFLLQWKLFKKCRNKFALTSKQLVLLINIVSCEENIRFS